ncbi:MAG: hypothetical protein JWR14_5952, partial [Caballeronia sp.]|nr:hypothetical protein [Caballeronia sp.]
MVGLLTGCCTDLLHRLTALRHRRGRRSRFGEASKLGLQARGQGCIDQNIFEFAM